VKSCPCRPCSSCTAAWLRALPAGHGSSYHCVDLICHCI
jgi:hypothetical protein